MLVSILAVAAPTVATAQQAFPWDEPGYRSPYAQSEPSSALQPSAPPAVRASPVKPPSSVLPAPASSAAPSGPSVTVQSELTRAKTQMEYRDWDAAIATLNAVLNRDASSASALLMRGNAYTGKGAFDDAIRDYSALISNRQNAAIASGNATAMAYANRAIAWQRKGDLDQAMGDLDKALQLEPRNTATLGRRAGLLRRKGNVDAAIRDYDRALKISPTDAELVSLRQLAIDDKARQSGGAPTAVTAGIAPQNIMPDTRSEDSNIRRGYELMSRGEIDPAIAEFDRALVANARSFIALTGRAQAFAMSQRYPDALLDLADALTINKSFAPIHTIRGLVFLMRGEHDRAIAALDEAIKLDASSADAYSYRGTVRNAKRQFDEAMQDLDRALAINPKLTLAFTTRGKIHAARDQHDKAVVDFDRALQLSPNLMATTLHRARSYEALGDNARALADYESVLTQNPVTLFDRAEQGFAKRRIDALSTSKSSECGISRGETCL